MSETCRPAPFFIADHVALDFLNSIACPRDTEFEWLATGTDVLDWLDQAGLLSRAERAGLEQSATVADLDQIANEIRVLREELRRFVQSEAGADMPDLQHPLIARLNALLAQGSYTLRITTADDDPGDPVLNTVQQVVTVRDLLPRLAGACARLICEAEFRYVKNCEGPTCSLYFLDTSKNHRRRWCTMEICGNRAKAAAHRKKKRDMS